MKHDVFLGIQKIHITVKHKWLSLFLSPPLSDAKGQTCEA